jgi:hypothetical protein
MISHFLSHIRGPALLVTSCLIVTACATGGNDPSLSPEENQLRAANARFNQTVGEGAAVGAVGGALAGALLGGHNRLAGAAIGAAAGGALGAGAGYVVARNNATRSHSEADYQKAIGEAQQEANDFRTSAQSARIIADRAVRELAVLDAQYRSKQITGAQYRAQVSKYQQDNRLIQDQAKEADSEVTSLRSFANGSGQNRGVVLQSAADIDNSRSSLQSYAAAISRALSSVPDAGPGV